MIFSLAVRRVQSDFSYLAKLRPDLRPREIRATVWIWVKPFTKIP